MADEICAECENVIKRGHWCGSCLIDLCEDCWDTHNCVEYNKGIDYDDMLWEIREDQMSR